MNIPDEVIEAAARAAYESTMEDGDTPWEHFGGSSYLDYYRDHARAAIEAAAAHLMASAWDECAGLPSRPDPAANPYRVPTTAPIVDPEIDALVDVLIEAERTADSPTVFTRWHHAAEYILSAGYRKQAGRVNMTAEEFKAAIREAQAQALETAAEIKVDGLYGEPLHTWLYARARALRQAP